MGGATSLGFDNETINYVYEKTDGYCYYCSKRLSFKNYGEPGNHGAWEIDHSKPKSKAAPIIVGIWFPHVLSATGTKAQEEAQATKESLNPRRLAAR